MRQQVAEYAARGSLSECEFLIDVYVKIATVAKMTFFYHPSDMVFLSFANVGIGTDDSATVRYRIDTSPLLFFLSPLISVINGLLSYREENTRKVTGGPDGD